MGDPSSSSSGATGFMQLPITQLWQQQLPKQHPSPTPLALPSCLSVTLVCAEHVPATAWCRVQALVLSPTRELATQTEKLVLAIGDYMNIQAHACIGGHSVGEDMRKLDAGVHVVSGTPGRVKDMMERQKLRTRHIKVGGRGGGVGGGTSGDEGGGAATEGLQVRGACAALLQCEYMHQASHKSVCAC